MDLTYPPAVQESLDRLGEALASVSVDDELAACEEAPELWGAARSDDVTTPGSPLGHVAEFRAMGAYALPLPALLARVRRSLVPLSAGSGQNPVVLGWPNATAPWQPGDPLTVQFQNDRLNGQLSVAPVSVPAGSVAFLAQSGSDVAVVECDRGRNRSERTGDAFAVSLEDAPGRPLAKGAEALRLWDEAVRWERLGLVGLAMGVIDRSWRIALDALLEGRRQGNMLASEQGAQFQLADNDIEKLAAEHLALDAAIDAERGQLTNEKLALVRYSTSSTAERCAARALHLTSLFLPHMTPIAHWLVRRAHHLAVFGPAREHEVRLASAGVVAGMNLEQ